MKRPPPLRMCLLAAAFLGAAWLPCAVHAGAYPSENPAVQDRSQTDLIIARDIRRASDALTQLLAAPPKFADEGTFVIALQRAQTALQLASSEFPRVPAPHTVATYPTIDPAAILDAARKDLDEAATLADQKASSVAPSLRQALASIAEARKQLPNAIPGQAAGPATATNPLANGPGTSPIPASPSPGWLPVLLNGTTIVLLLFLLFRLLRPVPAQPAGDASFDTVLSNLQTRATEAANKYKNLSANYDQLEEQYNDLAAQHEQISVQLADLRRQPKPPARDREPPDRTPELPNPAPPVLLPRPPEGSPTPEPISIPQPAPVPSFGSDPERDYLEARRKPDLQAEFKRIHSPVVVTCTNLAQRGVTGVQLTFVQDNRSSLFAVVKAADALIFPSFASDPAFARDLLEGIYAYPAEFNDLAIVAAARAERRNDTFYLIRPGQLRNA